MPLRIYWDNCLLSLGFYLALHFGRVQPCPVAWSTYPVICCTMPRSIYSGLLSNGYQADKRGYQATIQPARNMGATVKRYTVQIFKESGGGDDTHLG